MRHVGPISSSGPSPTSASRRIARILMIWTGVLIVLVVAEMRALPPILVGLLLPYLALMAWHLLARSGPRQENPLSTPADSESLPLESPAPQVVGCPPREGMDERVELSDYREPSSASAD